MSLILFGGNMKKQKPKDKQLKKWLKTGGRKGAKKDFLMLLKRAVFV